MIKKVLISASFTLLLVGCSTAPAVQTNSNIINPTRETNTVSTSTNTNNASTAANSSNTKYSEEMVAAHNTSSDCWAIINGKVYDLTNWEDKHLGGKEAILRSCGKDLSSLSGSHPGGDFSSSDLQDVLSQYYKGDIQ
ncbi:MAG: cytochrome b5 domain-containing protein [Candidatus Gracilibacteria bacterium]